MSGEIRRSVRSMMEDGFTKGLVKWSGVASAGYSAGRLSEIVDGSTTGAEPATTAIIAGFSAGMGLGGALTAAGVMATVGVVEGLVEKVKNRGSPPAEHEGTSEFEQDSVLQP